MPTPIIPDADRDLITLVFEDKVFSKFFCYLYSRWQDEREFENLDDYKKVIQERLPEEFQVTSMSNRPFEFRFKLTQNPNNIYSMRFTKRHFSWGIVAC